MAPSAGEVIQGYSYMPNGTGGVNYFFNGQPITNTEYRNATGVDTNVIERESNPLGETGGIIGYNPSSADSQLDTQVAFINRNIADINANAIPSLADSINAMPSAEQYSDTLSNSAAAPTETQIAAANKAAIAAANKAAIAAAARENTQKAIDSLTTESQVGNTNIDENYGSILSKYNKEAGSNEGDYTEQSTTNNQNLLKDKQNSLLAASQGRRGLRATLASLGALGGTGSELADKAVTTEANADIGEATNTFATNAQGLDKAIKKFRDEDEDRKKELVTSRDNQKTALKGTLAEKEQTYYQKMAELFNDEGNTASATDYLNRAGNLNPVIAESTKVASTPFTQRSAAFTPSSLEEYLAGAGDMTVSTKAGNMGPATSSLFAINQKKKKKATA